MTGNSWRQGKSSLIAIILFIGAVMLAECHSAPPSISIGGARAELSPAIYGEAMVSMTIKNDGGQDVLKAVGTDIPGAKASFHVMEGRRMARVATVDVRGGLTVFKVGGSHVMIEGMPRTMVEGSPFTLTLVFAKSGERRLNLKLEKAPALPASPGD